MKGANQRQRHVPEERIAMIEIEIRGLKQVRSRIRRLTPDIQRAVSDAILQTAFNIQREAKMRAPVDTGRLRSSIIVYPIRGFLGAPDLDLFRGGRVVGARVVAHAHYSLFVETGRHPGKMPPPDALAGWARRHGLAGLEFVIARAIGRRGIRPRPFFGPAVYWEAAGLTPRIERELLKYGLKPTSFTGSSLLDIMSLLSRIRWAIQSALRKWL
jgi:hypothetical protein